MLTFKSYPDSVEDGDKVVKTAIDSFGRVGEFLFSDLESCTNLGTTKQ